MLFIYVKKALEFLSHLCFLFGAGVWLWVWLNDTKGLLPVPVPVAWCLTAAGFVLFGRYLQRLLESDAGQGAARLARTSFSFIGALIATALYLVVMFFLVLGVLQVASRCVYGAAPGGLGAASPVREPQILTIADSGSSGVCELCLSIQETNHG